MAKLEKTLNESFDSVLRRVDDAVMQSVSATLEDSCDWRTADARCSVRVYERYSYMGGNRVSMNVTLFQAGNGPVKVCAITSGGSQAMFFKVNTWGEESFLDTLNSAL
mgnify:CR=1 FL=1